jgi:mannose/fructose-specific phosphotransferase system component IIA
MTPPFPTLLVAHRGFGEGLLEAAAAILGQRLQIDHLSNEGLSPEDLERRIDVWLEAHAGPAILLTDIGFGSCCQSARRATRGRATVAVMAGVNLPVLLAAIRSREHEDLAAYLRHLQQRGRESLELYVGGERR